MDQSVRNLFPVTQDLIYLDNAYLSPLATPVVEAARKFEQARIAGKAGRTDDWAEMMEASKKKLGRLIHTHSKQLALIGNTSEGTNIVANMIGLKPEDNVIWDDSDHISNQLIWLRQQKRIGFETRILSHQNGDIPVSAYEKVVDKHTKIISISLVAHNNGFRYDVEKLAELAHVHGAFLHVDAIQAVGTVQLDLSQSGIDFLTCGTYKWLLGPQGLGFFYIRPALLDQFEPVYSGWMQIKNWLSKPQHALDELYETARKFQTSTLDPRGIAELNAALDLILDIGIEKIETHNFALARQLWDGLAAMGLTMLTPQYIRSGIVACKIPPGGEVGKALAERGCIATDREGRLRFSPHLFNIADEIEKTLGMLKEIL